MARLEFQNVSKSFGEVCVLDDISFSVDPHEFVVLLGPSGCGKTTLLRLIAGLENPTSGQIILEGKAINLTPTRERDVAMVFQNYALYPHMSVADNLAFGLRMRKTPGKDIGQRVSRAASLLHIEDLLARQPRQLSGGQKQRVAMGRAMVRQPQVFLFDEPLSNLDAALRVKMRTEIKRLHQKLKITTLYVTHDQVEAMTLASKIVLLHDGCIQQIGSPAELFHKPANLFVAGFIGSPAMNFIRVSVEREAGGAMVVGWGRCDRSAIPEGISEAILGLRPEDLHPQPPSSKQGPWKPLEVGVQVTEPLGGRVQVTAAIDGQELVALVPETLCPAVGQRMTLWCDLSKAHLFDIISGRRLTSSIEPMG
jgi:multiple sugar transport system ATP-binding protein